MFVTRPVVSSIETFVYLHCNDVGQFTICHYLHITCCQTVSASLNKNSTYLRTEDQAAFQYLQFKHQNVLCIWLCNDSLLTAEFIWHQMRNDRLIMTHDLRVILSKIFMA